MQVWNRVPSELHPLLEEYIRCSPDYLKGKVVSIFILGGAALGDWPMKWGDIDFLVVVDSDIDSEMEQGIHSLHDYLIKKYGDLGERLEGDYYPLKKFCGEDIYCRHFSIHRRGEKRHLENGFMSDQDVKHIKRFGSLIYGEDLRNHLPTPDEKKIKESIASYIRSFIRHYHPLGPPFSAPKPSDILFGYSAKSIVFGWLQGAICLLHLKCGIEATKGTVGKEYGDNFDDQFSEYVALACRLRKDWPPQKTMEGKLKQLAVALPGFFETVWQTLEEQNLTSGEK